MKFKYAGSFMHVFIQIASPMNNDQEPLLGIFSSEEAITIIEFIYIVIPPQVDDLAVGKTP